MNSFPQRGFTLIELSIVLVIIGLIIGGVLLGQNLIRASEIRSVIKDVEMFQTAINSFRLKYNAVPGDMIDAESIWGSDSACPNTVTNTVQKTATCNGTGDGKVQDSDSSGNSINIYERYRAWQQLANAGLIQGMYTGVTGPLSGTDSVIGLNAPAARIQGTGYNLAFKNLPTGSSVDYPYIGHLLGIGLKSSTCLSLGCPAFTPAEMLSLDQKMDNALPGSGLIMGYKKTFSVNLNCTTSDTASAAQYDTSNPNVICTPIFILKGF